MTTFGERLHAAMVARGLNELAIARKCEVSKKAVEHWLALTGPHMRATHLLDLANLLNVRVRWLGDGEGKLMRFDKREFVTPT